MDFHAEMEKRKQQHLGQIGQLSYERCGLSKQVESCQKRIAEIDVLIAEQEAAIFEDDQAQRNFDTYLAVKEGAVTLDQIKQAVEKGEDLKAPAEAVVKK